MRVTIVGPAYPLRGGIAHHVYRLSQELAARGHAVQVISFRKLYPSLLFPGTSETDTSGLKLDAKAEPLLAPLNPATWARAVRAIKAFGPDAAIIQWWQPFFAPVLGVLARALSRRRIRTLAECHNVFPHEGTPLDRSLIKFALGPMDCFITHSESDRKELDSILPGRTVRVCPLPEVGEFKAPSHSPRDGRRILFFGKVRKYKGLDVLLRAMPSVISRVECELSVVGEFYDSAEKYLRMVRELGIERHVSIDNRYVPNEQVPELFEQADVLILPYLSATQSGVASIALSNGLPIIAARTGGLAETVIEQVNGLLFAPGNWQELADRITDYFKNNLGPELSKNILSATSNNSATRVGDVIEEMLAGKKARTKKAQTMSL
jgi:glycosyltransferase involved in cell wall biosynthesis